MLPLVRRMSLIKHGSQYLIGKGVPGLVHLAALTIFSRILAPEAYGQYALIIAGVGLANSVIFQWMRLGLLRFWPTYETRQEVMISTLVAGFCALIIFSSVIVMIGLAFVDDNILKTLLAFGLVLLWAEGMFELCQQLERSQMLPLRYGLLGFFKAVASLVIGVVLVLLGYGAIGLLMGTMAGLVLPLIWEIHFYRRYFSMRHVDMALLTKLFRYGLPLTATFALGFFIKSSDRFLLGYFLGAEDVGLYAVGANLAQHTIAMLMMVVNLAAFPLAVDALEKSGRRAANGQLEQNFTLLFATALPACVGVCMLAPNIATVLLGEAFRASASIVIPVITIGSLLAGIKAFYFDLSFQLGQKTMGQVWVSLVAALVNILLNLILIPRFGLLGAAFSMVATYCVGLLLSIVWGRRVFALPVPVRSLMKVVVATVGMALVLLPLRTYQGGFGLAVQILAGGVVFALLAWKLDVLKIFKETRPAKIYCQKV